MPKIGQKHVFGQKIKKFFFGLENLWFLGPDQKNYVKVKKSKISKITQNAQNRPKTSFWKKNRKIFF